MRAVLAVVVLLLAVVAPARADCPPEGRTREQLEALKVLEWTVPDAAERQQLAEGLVDCLGDADPTLRDGIAYEALSHWMRAEQIDEAGLRALRDRLYAALKADDPDGFRRPFAALVLSEVARTDRIKPWMSAKERRAMVETASRYLESVTDYRGFDDAEGWRHGVAHGSDWLMQLALNPALERKQLDRMLAAIATQVVPSTSHAYVYGEPGRLARPVLFIAKRALHTQAEWEAWFTALARKLGDAKAYNDNGWLLRRHDLLAFLTALYLEADRSDDPQLQALEAPVVAGLKAVP
ncbi:DUF3011 domain containing protein [Lysobacter dokdonensis DS-58]|uniref:DUF3011 domain containing protein n=1 Tax=Lysobacter dokdonensis DS-58 TaxID=1300345 RepID=A0A0A2WHD6_9GAMM|nr:DUF2785 domain-containing protein [Lysobacter dokdonensis]KGQ19611.1 DUF3011 domain containing protein [Lysobacter dokdonensis DS-58]